MYRCHIHFYLTGRHCRVFERIKEIDPLPFFTHEFLEDEEWKEELAAKADVIFVNLQGAADISGMVKKVLPGIKRETEIILLADSVQIVFSPEELSEIKDVWMLPMSDEETSFRFARWQQSYKMSKDFWQTSQYLDATINHVPNLIWYKDKNGIHEKVNDSFCKTVGKTKKQVEGRGHAYIWDVEHDDPACIESERIVMEKEETCVSEEKVKSGNGEKLLTTYKSPLYDIDGSVMGTVGVAIDVTKERAYEQEIIEKNRTLETIFSTMDCGVVCHTADGSRILSVNRAALRILGYESKDEMMEDGFYMVAQSVVDEDKGKLRKCIRELKKEGDSVSVEYRVRHKDGEILHVMGNIKLLIENGEPVYQRFLLDFTAQKLKEKENERHQMELVHALSINYNVVCFFDLDTGTGIPLRIASDDAYMFKSIFTRKRSMERSMELYIQKFVYEKDKEMLRDAFSRERLEKELAEKRTYYVNYRVLKGDKVEYFQVKAVRSGAWTESQGIVLGFRSIDEEIRSELEQKNLLEDALLQANKANEAKSTFLSNMSHDIRTPMNAIVGFTALAMNHIEEKEQVKGYLEKIMTSGAHLLRLINDVLDMSRIESGKMHLEEKPCSLTAILSSIKNIVQADAYAKQLVLDIEAVDVEDERIYCDELRLNQVLLNLLGNCIKYTGTGGKVSMRLIENAGAAEGYGDYTFFIRDTGIGMSSEFLSHIFEPFEREKNSTISGVQGTGLGMAITKNIVDMMKGRIEVKSEQGVGTEFIVSFTFRLSMEKEKKDAVPLYSKPVSPGKCRILLAEDNELNQEIAAEILGDAGFSTDIAQNGQAAVDMLKQSEPGYYQLILMDIQMPVMNGYEAVREIRSLEDKELASIPILAMTANAFEEDRQEALRCGMNGHIPKPIDVEKLLGTLAEILN